MTTPLPVRARAAAIAAFGWVAAAATTFADGPPGWTAPTEPDDSLYSGAVGILLAAAEARVAGLTGPAVDLAAAIARTRVLALVAGLEPADFDGDGLFSGWAGVAVALRAWASAAGDEEAAAAAELVTAGVADRAAVAPESANTDVISGDAGVLLGLLGAPAVDRVAAAAVADRLVAAAEDSPAGPQWRMVPDHPILMPNFSHGTAGVASALALAGRALDRPDLLAAAVRGAETLLVLGSSASGWALPMTIPRQAHRPPVAFGWCHGPSGTVRLFDLLARLFPDDTRWSATVAQCYDAVRHSGLPARHTPGFWDNVARCCGTAGVGTTVLDRYAATGDPDLLAWADVLAEDVLARAVVTADGACWSNHEHTATPPDLLPEPGFMQGAAGIAGWLARLATAHDDPGAAAVDLGVTPGWV